MTSLADWLENGNPKLGERKMFSIDHLRELAEFQRPLFEAFESGVDNPGLMKRAAEEGFTLKRLARDYAMHLVCATKNMPNEEHEAYHQWFEEFTGLPRDTADAPVIEWAERRIRKTQSFAWDE